MAAAPLPLLNQALLAPGGRDRRDSGSYRPALRQPVICLPMLSMRAAGSASFLRGRILKVDAAARLQLEDLEVILALGDDAVALEVLPRARLYSREKSFVSSKSGALHARRSSPSLRTQRVAARAQGPRRSGQGRQPVSRSAPIRACRAQPDPRPAFPARTVLGIVAGGRIDRETGICVNGSSISSIQRRIR